MIEHHLSVVAPEEAGRLEKELEFLMSEIARLTGQKQQIMRQFGGLIFSAASLFVAKSGREKVTLVLLAPEWLLQALQAARLMPIR